MRTFQSVFALPILFFALSLGACGDDDPADADTSGDSGTLDDTSGGDDSGGEGPDDDGLYLGGMDGTVRVWTDEWGIPHLVCETDADCAMVLGYLHARDRFAQMDLRRRLTTGRLHQLVGSLVVDLDVANRNLYSTPDGRPAEEVLKENLSPDSLRLLEAYALGVNEWLLDLELGKNGARLAIEYDFPLIHKDVIPPWTVEDSLSTVLALVNGLTNDSDREIALGLAWASVSPEQALDLYGPMPATDSNILQAYGGDKARGLDRLPPPRVNVQLEHLSRATGALQQALDSRRAADLLRHEVDRGDTGSNNWVLAPSATGTGHALFSNDPHLTLSNPAIWYLAHLDAVSEGSGTFQSAGHTFAGLPWVVIGQNEFIAWGATNSYLDLSDVYVETLTADGKGVVFNGEEVPFIEVPFTVEPPDAEPSTHTLRFVPHHGPVLSMDLEEGTAISLAWTGNRVTTDPNFLTQAMRATTVDELRIAAREITSIGQNWVAVDTQGSIGWFPYNSLPTRPWASMELPTFLPLPGDGSAEWGDPLPLEELPQAYNPVRGYIATANNDMTGALADGDPYNDGHTVLQVGVADGFRHARIVERIEADLGAHDFASMESIVADVHSLIGEQLVPVILEAIQGEYEFEGAAEDAWEALVNWDFNCPTGLDGIKQDSPAVTSGPDVAASIGCTVFHVMMGRLIRVFDDELEAAGGTRSPSWSPLVRLILRPETLVLGEAWWDDVSTEDVVEGPAEVMIEAIEYAGGWLANKLGADPDTWRWGRLHTLTLPADLFGAFGIDAYDNGPWANDGGLFTVDVASPGSARTNNFTHTHGASTRWVCEAPESGVRCTVQVPGGQIHHRGSPFYENLLLRWLKNESVPMLMDLDEIRSVAGEPLVFAPLTE